MPAVYTVSERKLDPIIDRCSGRMQRVWDRDVLCHTRRDYVGGVYSVCWWDVLRFYPR